MADVLYIDNHILILNKPNGVLTQPNQTQDESLEVFGKVWLKNKFNKPGNVFLGAVHRIDRPVSGIVVFARTSKALSRLNASLRAGNFDKEYVAYVEGLFPQDKGVLEHYLQRLEFQSQVVSKEHPEGKRSLLAFSVLERKKKNTLLSIKLITGRYHQIRVQLSAMGYPIVGDQKYGSKNCLDYLFLHHASVRFPHPVTNAPLYIEAPFPAHWQHH